MEAILVDGKVLLYKDVLGVYFLHKNDVCVKCGRLKRFELLRPDSKVIYIYNFLFFVLCTELFKYVPEELSREKGMHEMRSRLKSESWDTKGKRLQQCNAMQMKSASLAA